MNRKNKCQPGSKHFISTLLTKICCFFGMIRSAGYKQSEQGVLPTIVIHGGAGTILKEKMTPDVEKSLRAGLYEAIKKGYDILQKGGAAIDAVEAAVRELENNPLFNAGKGAVFNIKGINQLEASIMDGQKGTAGAATLLTTVKNPISLARKVMESDHHVFLGGAGAESYAKEQDLEIVDPSYFWTKHRWEQHERGFLHSACAVPTSSSSKSDHWSPTSTAYILDAGMDEQGDFSHLPMGTVGAVAVDILGAVAAATSTGGMSNKWDGRIGDTPIIGAGTWADKAVAISGTGTGEYFIRQGTAQFIASRIGLLKEGIGSASKTAVVQMKQMGGEGGVICVDSSGNISMTFCSAGMYRGYCSRQTGHSPVIGIFHDEVIAPGDNHVAK